MYTKSHISRVLVAATFSLIAATGCKQASNSGASNQKTIENMTRADVNKITLNYCGVDSAVGAEKEALAQAASARAEGSPEAKTELLKALRSAPLSVLKNFHSDVGGKFVLNSGMSTACKNVGTEAEKSFFSESSTSAPIACWKAAENGGPVIYLSEGQLANESVTLAKNIRHNSIRMLGYVYGQFFIAKLRLRIDEARQNLSAKHSASELATLQKLISAMQGSLDKFVENRTAVKQGLFKDLAKSSSQALGRLQKFSDAVGTAFDDFVFAEAFDSYYCSETKTRPVFLKNTVNTANAFNAFVSEIGQ